MKVMFNPFVCQIATIFKLLIILFIIKLLSVLNHLISFFRTFFTSKEEVDLATCIRVVCNAGFSFTKAEIMASRNICIFSQNLCHKELHLRFCRGPRYTSMHLHFILLFFRKIFIFPISFLLHYFSAACSY